MTDEEKKMLEIFKKEVEKEQSEYEQVNEYTKFFYNNHKEILNLIHKQREELTRTKTDLQNAWHNNLELAEKCLKKDKIIDEMAKYIDFDKMNFQCSSLCVKEDCQEECIKQYFEKKVEMNK